MKNILLLAKSYALKSESKTIGINHIKKSVKELSSIILENEKMTKIIEESLETKVESKDLNIEDIKKSIEVAKEEKTVLFSPATKKFVKNMEENGFSKKEEKLSLDIQKPKEENSLDVDTFNEKDPIKEAIQIKSFLEDKIYGQPQAVEAVVDNIKNIVVKPDDRPSATFLFLGPPATGKTYLANLIAEFEEDTKFLELSMQNYAHPDSGMEIFGSDSGYTSATPGLLTDMVKRNPNTVVLLDEFEKAHTSVQKEFLTIFSAAKAYDNNGWLIEDNEFEDNYGKLIAYNSSENDHKEKKEKRITEVDFTQTIFIITSNLGSELYNNAQFLDELKNDYEKAETQIIQALAREEKIESGKQVKAIPAEMISRLSQAKIILFNSLSFVHLQTIATNVFKEKMSNIEKQYNVSFNYDETFDAFLKCSLLKFSPYLDVRRIKSKIHETFVDKITDFMLHNEVFWREIKHIKLHVSKSVLEFLENEIDPKIKDETLIKYLFRKNLTYDYNFEITKDKDTITLNIDNGKLNQIKNISDMMGSGALVFEVPSISFDDISGHEHVKMRLKETANYLKNMDLLKKLGAKAPSGMLLYGKPGTGKTMMAKAFANYAELPFIQTTPNELTAIDKETGKMQMESIFIRAKEYAPSIIFIDEIDSFGDRTKGGNSKIINELLKQMDGFEKNYDEPVFILGATNHRQNIDSAILRPGRLDLHLEVPVLDKEGRAYFIDKILENNCAKNISKEKLIMYTATLTGAQIQKIGNEALLYMIRKGLSELTEEILIEQINIEKYGQKITNKSILEELEETAYHEAGHAIISKLLKPRAKIEQITITPRDRSLGFVSFDVESLGGNLSKSDIENEICVAYAGREAQMRFADEMGFDTGASNDLKQATRMAYLYVARYGMDDEIGYINIDGIPRKYSQLQESYEMEGFMQSKIEQRVQELLKEQKNRTQKLIEDNWEHIEVLAKQLQDKEVLHEEEIYSLIEKL